ncbi:subtilisin-like serine protease [Neofusicoccum parvum]|uniref:Subtilisin-like serine protease n=1 Tax=Neofusicoccum parvum TaxID=310453 RepID=A0ACB5SLG0_9PEZI|nr:subtilisin-like serine protease [Neofusicoccum parvum]
MPQAEKPQPLFVYPAHAALTWRTTAERRIGRSPFFPPFTVDVLQDPKAAELPAQSTPSGLRPAQEPHRGGGQADGQPTTPRHILRLLPATWRNADDDIETPRPGCRAFLTKELCVPRLNAIHDSMWVVGRPMPPRSLTAQLVHRRELVLTEDMNLHLVWAKGFMFMKPIPRFLLSPDFWRMYLTPGDSKALVRQWSKPWPQTGASTAELAPCAAGFLFSWTALISHESDFKIAHDKGLIPGEVTWWGWKELTEQLLAHAPPTVYGNINERFHYGELRLGRLNKIYRLRQLNFRGYWFRYSQSADFFEDNFTRLASVLGYIVIVLTAMQVGLGTTKLQESQLFQDASYGFTVFSIVAPLIAIALVLAVFVILVLWNVLVTKIYEKKRFGTMGIKKDVQKPDSV